MKLENICISFEYAKKLKEIGIKQESLFSWFIETSWYWKEVKKKYFEAAHEERGLPLLSNSNEYYSLPNKNTFNCYSAFTASELLNMLPQEVDFKNYEYNFYPEIIKTDEKKYRIHYYNIIEESAVIICGEIVNILSNMIIYLIENKLVSVEEINERI